MSEGASTRRQQVLERIFSRVPRVKALPHIVYKVLEALERQSAPLSEVEREINFDPGFTARLLSMANSAQFGLATPVKTVKDALMILGVNVVRNFAMNASAMDFFDTKNKENWGRRQGWWRQSVDTAVLSRKIAEETGAGSGHMAYTLGLIHLIGTSMLDECDPAGYSKVQYVVERGAPLRMAEATVFGVDHIDVIQSLAESWKLPEEMQVSLDYENLGDESHPVAAVLAIAHYIVESIHSGATDLEFTPVLQAAGNLINMNQEQMNGWFDASKQIMGQQSLAA